MFTAKRDETHHAATLTSSYCTIITESESQCYCLLVDRRLFLLEVKILTLSSRAKYINRIERTSFNAGHRIFKLISISQARSVDRILLVNKVPVVSDFRLQRTRRRRQNFMKLNYKEPVVRHCLINRPDLSCDYCLTKPVTTRVLALQILVTSHLPVLLTKQEMLEVQSLEISFSLKKKSLAWIFFLGTFTNFRQL